MGSKRVRAAGDVGCQCAAPIHRRLRRLAKSTCCRQTVICEDVTTSARRSLASVGSLDTMDGSLSGCSSDADDNETLTRHE